MRFPSGENCNETIGRGMAGSRDGWLAAFDVEKGQAIVAASQKERLAVRRKRQTIRRWRPEPMNVVRGYAGVPNSRSSLPLATSHSTTILSPRLRP